MPRAMPERINAGQALVITGAVALFVSLFLDWYEPGLSAWTVFELGDLVLAGLALVALATALPTRLGGAPEPRPLVSPSWLPWLAGAALAFVVLTLVNDPPAARERSLELGAWIGLVGALLLAAGGLLSTARVSLVISSRAPDAPPAGAVPAPAERVRREGTTATRPLEEDEPG
jgi:hypothetical protein